MSALIPPEKWKNQFVSVLEILVWLREKFLHESFSPQVLMFANDVWAMNSFINGMSFHLDCCGSHDEELGRFYEWLRDVKGEFPSPGGWAMYYLTQTGDHLAAIMRFLDRCAEFVALRQAQK